MNEMIDDQSWQHCCYDQDHPCYEHLHWQHSLQSMRRRVTTTVQTVRRVLRVTVIGTATDLVDTNCVYSPDQSQTMNAMITTVIIQIKSQQNKSIMRQMMRLTDDVWSIIPEQFQTNTIPTM